MLGSLGLVGGKAGLHLLFFLGNGEREQALHKPSCALRKRGEAKTYRLDKVGVLQEGTR